MQVNMTNFSSRNVSTTNKTPQRADFNMSSVTTARTEKGKGEVVEDALKKLTEEQKQEIRDKYDINNIEPYSEEHEALLQDLRNIGVISESDRKMGSYGVKYANLGFHKIWEKEPWRAEDGGSNLLEFYSFREDELIHEYGKTVANMAKAELSFDAMMQFASDQAEASRAYGRIADVLKDIFG